MNASSDAIAGMTCVAGSVFSSSIASRASASLSYTLRILDRKNAMRLVVIEAHDPSNSSFAARVRDCSPTPSNCGDRSSEAARCYGYCMYGFCIGTRRKLYWYAFRYSFRWVRYKYGTVPYGTQKCHEFSLLGPTRLDGPPKQTPKNPFWLGER